MASSFAGLRGGAPSSSTTPAPAASSQPEAARSTAVVAVPHPDVAISKQRTEEGRQARLRELALQQRTPSEMEKQAAPADLEMIRKRYGSQAQMIITLLLTMDAYFACFWVGHKRIGFRPATPVMETHALAMCRVGAWLPLCYIYYVNSHTIPTHLSCLAGIDFQEMMERVTMSNSKSWYPHIFYMVAPMVVLIIGCLHAVSISALEMLNAEVKRVGASNATKRVELKAEDETAGHIIELRVKEGPARKVFAKPATTTMSFQTASFIIARQRSRYDPDAIKHRRGDRLFGEKGQGRLTKRKSFDLPTVVEESGWDAVLAQYVSTGYVDSSAIAPENDTCLRAFCRLLLLEEQAAELPAA